MLFTLLKKRRTDIVLYEKLAGLGLVARHGLDGVYPLSPPLAVKPMYLYLHRRNGHLVGKAARAIAEMKEDGTYGRICDQTIKPFLDRLQK